MTISESELEKIEARARAKAATANDAEFIAQARADVPRLVAEVRELREKIAKLERWVSTTQAALAPPAKKGASDEG